MRHHPVQSAISMVGSMAIIGVIDNAVAVIARDVSLWQFQLTRAMLALPLVFLLCVLLRIRARPKRIWAVLVRNGLIAIGMLFYFGSLAFLPIAQALAGLFVAPIFVLLISVLVFGERVGWLRILAVILGFVGVLMVLRPDGQDMSILALMPMMGGLFYAMGSVATQRLCADENTPVMLLGLFFLQGLFGLVALIGLELFGVQAPMGSEGFLTRTLVWPATLTWGLIALQAVGSVLGVGLLIRAYQLASPSFAAVFEYSVFVFGPVSAYFLFGQTLSALQLAGIALIVATGATIALRGRA